MNSALCLMLAAALCAQLGFAQTDPWERVKLIEPGKQVSVSLVSGKTAKGKLVEWKPEGLVLRAGRKPVEIAKSGVAKVYFLAGMSRGRRTAWAFGIGFGVAAALYGGLFAAYGGLDSGAETVAVAAAGGAFCGGIAAGIAALIPQHKEFIYESPPGAPAVKK